MNIYPRAINLRNSCMGWTAGLQSILPYSVVQCKKRKGENNHTPAEVIENTTR